MTLILSVVLSAVVLLTLAVFLMLRRFAPGKQELPVTTEWLGELSAERYRPMLRVLDKSDFQFLSSQKGFTPAMAKNLRCQRAGIFRGYLSMLEVDFQRICATLRMILAHSEVDRPELAGMLVQCQIRFAAGIVSAHVRLLLFRFGVNAVDAEGLVRLFDSMRIELTSMVPSAAAIPA
jgi:hypothetical protein